MLRIIGVDPGLASTGWGVIETDTQPAQRVRYLSHGCIETIPDKPLTERLLFIHDALAEILETWKPTEAAVETLYFGRNITSALPVAEARGVLCMTLAEAGLPVRELTPNAIKQAVVGAARADKEQVQEMARLILGLDAIPKPNHAADALGAAICCAYAFIRP
ncbi:MAG: crossover junction endodeoxyribonuclease RuvC [Treponema sp.]|jgi:crossover junction endodeoxyribonuclease RuvC|nr:crossover junction endodeoxyribonuclease RuvC [Treponema sp.]